MRERARAFGRIQDRRRVDATDAADSEARLLPRRRSVYLSSRFNRSREEKNRLRASTGWMMIDAGRITFDSSRQYQGASSSASP